MSIHPTASVDPKAELGDVAIAPYAVIGPHVTLSLSKGLIEFGGWVVLKTWRDAPMEFGAEQFVIRVFRKYNKPRVEVGL